MARLDWFEHSRDGALAYLGKRYERKLGYNTRMIGRRDGVPWVIFHGTCIAQYEEDGVLVSTGGWWTVTTKNRINQLLPRGYAVYSKGHTVTREVWDWESQAYVKRRVWESDWWLYRDGQPVQGFYNGIKVPYSRS